MKIREWFKKRKERKFLAKHGCETWEQYNYRFDPDITPRADTVSKLYSGYTYTFIYPLDGYKDYGFPGVLPFLGSMDDMQAWCKQNCKHKWRNDWHRGFRERNGDFTFNSIGGEDVMVFAFQDEQEALMFRLRF